VCHRSLDPGDTSLLVDLEKNCEECDNYVKQYLPNLISCLPWLEISWQLDFGETGTAMIVSLATTMWADWQSGIFFGDMRFCHLYFSLALINEESFGS
jgi:hypothetical protein